MIVVFSITIVTQAAKNVVPALSYITVRILLPQNEMPLAVDINSLFNVSTVEVKIINGRYTPCTSCRWARQCVIPNSGLTHSSINYLQESKVDSIKTVFTCKEFTIKDNPKSRGY